MASAVYKKYDRSVYNLLDVLTTIGGLFSSLSVIGASMTKVFGYNLFLSSLIRQLYHFKPRFENEIKAKKEKKPKKQDKVDDEEDQKPDDDDSDEQDDDQTQAVMNRYVKQLSMMKEGSERLFESMHKVLGKVKVDFNFKTGGIIKMFACLRIIRKRDSLRKKSKETRQVLFFLKGRE